MNSTFSSLGTKFGVSLLSMAYSVVTPVAPAYVSCFFFLLHDKLIVIVRISLLPSQPIPNPVINNRLNHH